MRTNYNPWECIALKWIIVANITIFLIQNLLKLGNAQALWENYLSLSNSAIKSGYIWTFITYSFLHDTNNFFHIFFNMIVIFFAGKTIEPLIGTRKFLKLYFWSALLGGISWSLLNTTPQSHLIGASAAGFGLMVFMCLMYYEQYLTVLLFFVIPVLVKPKWLLWSFVIIEAFLYLFYEMPGKTVVASSAHLGGILGGYIMYYLLITKRSFLSESFFGKIFSPKRKNGSVIKTTYKVNIGDKQQLKKEVDRILDKITASGFGALTDEEKKTLDEAKEVLKE